MNFIKSALDRIWLMGVVIDLNDRNNATDIFLYRWQITQAKTYQNLSILATTTKLMHPSVLLYWYNLLHIDSIPEVFQGKNLHVLGKSYQGIIV